MSIDNIKLSQTARDQLVQLKRRTGVNQWNVLSRWGLCLSLAEDTPPRHQSIPADSSVEMTWHTFGGQQDEIYQSLIRDHYHKEEFKELSHLDHFRMHLHRGIGYLAGDVRGKTIAGLLQIAVEAFEEHDDSDVSP